MTANGSLQQEQARAMFYRSDLKAMGTGDLGKCVDRMLDGPARQPYRFQTAATRRASLLSFLLGACLLAVIALCGLGAWLVAGMLWPR